MRVAVTLAEVNKTFGPTRAVRGVSLEVEEGQCLGLIGPNGAGKTTTFSLIAGYAFPTSGSLKVLGVNPGDSGALKGRVGVLPQDAALPSVRVGDLLTYWARLSGVARPEAEARSVLEAVGLSESWRGMANQLSHGMAKRVALAQALLGEPPLLLLDEPTEGLDPRIAAQIRQLISDRRGKHTIIISSHNLSELEQLCDAAAILDRGALVQTGSMDSLTSQDAEFRVQVARGEIPREELQLVKGVKQVLIEPGNVLLIRYGAKTVPVEDVLSDVLTLVLARGVRVLGVTRGRRLEQKVLELTAPKASLV